MVGAVHADFEVIGGGVAGLVTARALARAGASVVLHEATDRLGGPVASHEVAGLVLDAGAESFAVRGGTVAALLSELGLGDDIVAPRPGPAWLQPAAGDAVQLPATGLLGIPVDPLAADVIAVIGADAAARAAQLDAVPATDDLPESLGELVRQRMGADLRTTAFLQPSIPILREAGLWQRLEPFAAPLQIMRIIDAGGAEPVARLVRDFDASDISDAPFGWNLPNWLLRREITARLDEMENVSFRPGTATTALMARESEAVATLSDGSRVAARLVIVAGVFTSHSDFTRARSEKPPDQPSPTPQPVRITRSPASKSDESERRTTPAKSMPGTIGKLRRILFLFRSASPSL